MKTLAPLHVGGKWSHKGKISAGKRIGEKLEYYKEKNAEMIEQKKGAKCARKKI